MLHVIVIGAGQAGLSAAGQLVRKGLRPWRDFVVLDGNDGPGGAWRHRWDSLTFDAAHGIHDLPGFPLGHPDPREPSSRVVSRYYNAYERELALPVVRPARVSTVTTQDGDYLVTTADGTVRRTRTVISATGTWDRPYLPAYPGRERFAGRQLHTRDFTSAEDFAGQRVLVVGGGTSALQFVLQLEAAGATTVWSTRRAPDWTDRFFDASWGVDVEAAVSQRTTLGLPPLSVVAATGLPVTQQYLDGILAGHLLSRGRLLGFGERSAILDGPGPGGRRLPSQGPVVDRILREQAPNGAHLLPGRTPETGTAASTSAGDTVWETPIDTVLWATGFRAALDHLRPLRLRERGGGITMAADGVSVAARPGLFLVGYGASASTIGATRAGRAAAVQALRTLRAHDAHTEADTDADPVCAAAPVP